MIILYLLVFFLGSALGSFINMLVYRIPKEESLWGYSYNDMTGEELAKIDLIPIWSYVIFKGKDRKTKKKLPVIYPIIEFISGITSVSILYVLINNLPLETDLLIQFILWQVLAFGLLFFATYDYFNWSLPRKYLYGFLITLILVLTINQFFYDLFILKYFSANILAGLIAFIFMMVLVAISKGKGLVFNDALLGAYAGILVGIDELIYLLLVTATIGSLFGLLVLKRSQRKRDAIIQFAPFFAGSALLLMFIEIANYLPVF